ncbi:LOW QUALITY PROTEIN: solute carrier family 43 member 3a [Spinachia spinachia]
MPRYDGLAARPRYRLTLATGLLEWLCFAGVVFGYASLVFVLKEDGYFRRLCVSVPVTNSTGPILDCCRQDEQFSLVFTIAAFLNNFLTMANGYLFDFGTMVTRLLGVSLIFSQFPFTTNLQCMQFILVPLWNDLHTCLCILQIRSLQWTAVKSQSLCFGKVGNLFAAHRSTVITLYNGAFDSSASVFLIITVLHEQGISLRSSLLVVSFRSIFHLVRSFLLMPRTYIPYTPPQRYTYGLNCRKSNCYNVEQFEGTRGGGDKFTGVQGRDTGPRSELDLLSSFSKCPRLEASFRSCVRSWFFLWHVVWLSIMQLRHYLFIGTLNPMLNRLANNDPDLVSQYTNAFAVTQLLGVLCAPWNGLIMDRHKGKPLAPGETAQEADLNSSSRSLFLTSLQCLLFSVCASVPLLPLQYITFVLQVLNRSFLYGGNAAFISIVFPARHFGKLYGLVMSTSALVSLLQYPCFTLVKGALGGGPFFVSAQEKKHSSCGTHLMESSGRRSDCRQSAGIHPSRLRLYTLQDRSPQKRGQRPEGPHQPLRKGRGQEITRGSTCL